MECLLIQKDGYFCILLLVDGDSLLQEAQSYEGEVVNCRLVSVFRDDLEEQVLVGDDQIIEALASYEHGHDFPDHFLNSLGLQTTKFMFFAKEISQITALHVVVGDVDGLVLASLFDQCLKDLPGVNETGSGVIYILEGEQTLPQLQFEPEGVLLLGEGHYFGEEGGCGEEFDCFDCLEPSDFDGAGDLALEPVDREHHRNIYIAHHNVRDAPQLNVLLYRGHHHPSIMGIGASA